MMYPKIHTIWKRHPTTFKIIEGDHSQLEFKAIDLWHVTEKIDGMNVRIEFNDLASFNVEINGRTNNAQVPKHLLDHLKSIFTMDKLQSILKEKDSKHIILYGEGYGIKIQNGGRYSKEPQFALFDVWIDDWWLEPDNVQDIAKKLGVKTVPFLGCMTTEQAIDLIKRASTNKGLRLHSQLSEDRTLEAEGIVARSIPLMLFRNHNPIVWKLKIKDYREAKK